MADTVKLEAALYEPTRLFVNTAFLQRLRDHITTTGSQIFVADTSMAPAKDGGLWSRPDVAALVIARGQFVPHWVADLHTFEVKTASGVNESSVHEANSHGRFGRFAWLVFQATGRVSPDTDGLRRIAKVAGQLGVGIIHFDDPTRPNDWVIALWPRATGADDATADSFVRERFPNETKQRITARLNALGWSGALDDH